MRDKHAIQLLVQELHNDYHYMLEANDLRERAVTRVQAVNWNDELDLMVLGSCLHNMYNSIEAYLLRVAKFFENSVDERQWHRDLLDRMTLEIPDVRPALITDRTCLERIDELRRFRHLFRNLYKTRLQAPKLKIVNDAAAELPADFSRQHTAFTTWLQQLATHLS